MSQPHALPPEDVREIAARLGDALSSLDDLVESLQRHYRRDHVHVRTGLLLRETADELRRECLEDLTTRTTS